MYVLKIVSDDSLDFRGVCCYRPFCILLILILLTLVFSLLILVRFSRGLSILFIFFKEPAFYYVDCLHVFLFVSISLISTLIFIIFLLLFLLGFACSCFYRSLRCSIRSLICDLSDLLIYTLMAINFPLRTAFAVSHRFQEIMFSFSLTCRNLLISCIILLITHWSLSKVLFSLQLFACFLLFFWVLVLMHCDQIECMGFFPISYICWGLLCAQDMINLLKVPWAAEKNVYSAEFEGNIL
jgi:hypothetical protein